MRIGIVRQVLGISLVAASAGAADRVAQVSELTGGVTIARAEDGQLLTASQAGPRVRNGSLFPGDILSTAKGSTATLLFADGTTLAVEPESKLTVREVDLSAEHKKGTADKPSSRRIKILAGEVLAKVLPNPQLATEFETPSGVASVKGTVLRVGVKRDSP